MTKQRRTNRLAGETSPYLLQHKHNPVDWYPWGDEAITRAREDNKPILLSIGYSACHWCHVMERESFENEEIARLMNENFVNIKVDREERPDLDQIYMNAVQMITGHGGWPLTAFLTPELVPFFGGTYFPPEDRHGMPGFPRVLVSIAEAYRTRPDDVTQSAWSILSELRKMNTARESNEILSFEMLDAAFDGMKRNYDKTYGGFGRAPKFPAGMNLEFCLRHFHRTNDTEALEIVTHTCHRMAEGGMYDQLGGGFHRYSTDAEWLAPHFEKMLYDNALLSHLYLHVYQATGDDFFRRIAEETLDYILREMTDANGGFYSTQDADSEGVEGKFFVWSKTEVVDLLGAEDGRLFCDYYDVSERGNWEDHNILRVVKSSRDVARDNGVTEERVNESLARSREILFQAREKRVKPGRDEKILTAWNGLALTSFSEALIILDRRDYREAAERNVAFLLENMIQDDLLLHSYKDGRARFNAYLDDYANFASGLISLYESTGVTRWLQAAIKIANKMIEEFWDDAEGGFFYTGASHEQLIVRTKDYFDNATPSGNSVAADALLRLAALTDNEDYRRRAVTIFRLLRASLQRYPSAFGQLLSALDFHLSTPKEIAIVRVSNADDAREMMRAAWQLYLPNKIVACAAETDAEAIKLIPLLRERFAIDGRPTAYVCVNRSCQLPARTATELAAQLSARDDGATDASVSG
ncbi:MAG: thioredoxin domain-containing protein [Pyrinomonadaceae bacterium]